MSSAVLPSEYLQNATLRPEAAECRKKVYLVTLPHPRICGQGGLRKPATYDRQQMVTIMRHIFANPVYDSLLNHNGHAAGDILERMCVFQE